MSRPVLTTLLALLVSCGPRHTLESLRRSYPSSYQELRDRDGVLLQESRTNHKVNRRRWTELGELPETLIKDLVRLEDRRFWQHPGVDPLALAKGLLGHPRRGGSTISMQLAGILQGHRGRRGILPKLEQLGGAVALELALSKREILEAYLNLVPFKGELVGIAAGARDLFGKDPRGLTRLEGIALLALLPSPNVPERVLQRRSCRYAAELQLEGDCESLLGELGQRRVRPQLVALAPHALRRFTPANGQRSSLRAEVQAEAQSSLSSQLRLLEHQNVTDGAVLVVERPTGEIVAYVGSSGSFSLAPEVDHVQAPRQAGSTLKPFLFAQALEQRLLTMDSPISDEPFSVTRDGITYRPENYTKSFQYQDVPLKTALASSLNIPAVKVMDLVGPEAFFAQLQELGFGGLKPADFYGHSMALGAVDVTLWDLTRAYLALANGGQWQELSFGGAGQRKKLRSFGPGAAHIISTILSEKEYRHLTFGYQSRLVTSSWSAVKTGTSKDMRDNWCVGFTDRFVIGVWVGNSSGQPMKNVSGISGAAPVFARLVEHLHRESPSAAPALPSGIVKVDQGLFLAGTEPRGEIVIAEGVNLQRITSPQHGSQFAYDPEIPPARQRIFFRAQGPAASWRLNGEELSAEEVKKGFIPSFQGSFRLELWDGAEKRDEVLFHVRAGAAAETR
jgi:penicillin-binding protein 1C